MSTLRWCIAHFAFPVTLGSALWAAHVLYADGNDEPWWITLVVSTAATWLLLLQRLHPKVPAWRRWGPDLRVDLLHTVVGTQLGALLGKALFLGMAFSVADALGKNYGALPWPTAWPMVAQLALALLIAEATSYTYHRASHEWGWLWRFHALHHSSERLYVFSSGRSHPLHVAGTHALQLVPLVAIGAHGEVLALMSVFTGVHGLLQHANIDLKLGWWNWIFSTADLHRWHHSALLEESNTNYGNNLIVFDLLFGTRFLPNDRVVPAAVGLGPTPFPQTFLGQLASPFTWRA